MGLEGHRDVPSDERVASAEAEMLAELFLDPAKCEVLPQAGRNLSAVFNHKQTEVAVALLEHGVVCLPYLFGGGTEGEPGVGEARFGEGVLDSVFVAFFLGLGLLDVGGDGGAPGRVVGRHGERSFFGVRSFIYYSVTGATEMGQWCE